ncbi:MAG: ferredoxin [Clostridiales bacterium]|jgi:ferredoxin|nr:ferredoxin [Clostridiales bacterium]
MKASVDPDLCIGCGLCPSVCPEVFQMNDDDLAEAYVDEVPDELFKEAEDARDGCPTSAISLDE